jgi:hypothetical protein
MEGWLRLNEVAEGGTRTYKLALEKRVLWSKESQNICPPILPFNVALPTMFQAEDRVYVSMAGAAHVPATIIHQSLCLPHLKCISPASLGSEHGSDTHWKW